MTGLPAAVLNALPDPVMVSAGPGRIKFVNAAAEGFFGAGAGVLLHQDLRDLVPFASPLLSLIQQVEDAHSAVSEHRVVIGSRRQGERSVDLHVAPLAEMPGDVVIRLQVHGMADRLEHQMARRGALRSVVGITAMLAHEVKNPLSGIRGAAQLLEQTARQSDHVLTRLIVEESDRICALIDRMEAFSDERPARREPINIHQVLDHVRRIAQAGFADHVQFEEHYDPSLPALDGDRDQLIQVFLNLLKNAAEAVPASGGEITIATAYRPGIRIAIPGSADRARLALCVSIADTGPGIAEEVIAHLFEPFVTTKSDGSGLGLALAAKLISEHGGMIEAHNRDRGAMFEVILPIQAGAADR